MKDNWNEFFEMLIHHEGGFSDDVRYSGNKEDGHGNQGSTMLGVTAITGQSGQVSQPQKM